MEGMEYELEPERAHASETEEEDLVVEEGTTEPEDAAEPAAAWLAERITTAPADQLHEAFGGWDEQIGLADVHDSVQRYDYQEALLREVGAGVPCLNVSTGPVPLLLLEAENPREDDEFRRLLLAEWFHRAVSYTSEGQDRLGRVESHDYDSARSLLRDRLTAFLVPRVSSRSGPQTNMPHDVSNFRVETHGRNGLRIHYSPAYFLRSTLVFGTTLSTPVSGYLRPGRYIFGPNVRGGVQWDTTATYAVPGHPDVAHLP